MVKQYISQKLRLKIIEDTRNYSIKEMWIDQIWLDQSELMRKKHTKNYEVLNCIEHLLILAFAVTASI